MNRGGRLFSHFGALASLTIPAPGGNISGQAGPNIPAGYEPACCADTGVGEEVDGVENSAAEGHRYHWPHDA